MTVKLLWLPGPAHYRLRVFAGRNTQHRAFAGELTLEPAEASELRQILLAGSAAIAPNIFSEAGWVEPVPAGG